MHLVKLAGTVHEALGKGGDDHAILPDTMWEVKITGGIVPATLFTPIISSSIEHAKKEKTEISQIPRTINNLFALQRKSGDNTCRRKD